MRNLNRWKQLGVSAVIYVGAVVALAAIGAGVFFGAKSYVDSVDKNAFERGRLEAVAAYEARDNKALADATQRIRVLQEQLRAKEAAAAAEVAAIDSKYQKELANAKTQRERDIVAARSGAIRLRDYWRDQAAACAADSDRIANSPATGAARSGNGARGAELSPEAVGFLLGEANRADAVVDKLTAAQALIRKYEEIVNGRN